MNRVKFAVSPDIQVGGRRFSTTDFSLIAELVGANADIELTTLQQLIVEMDEDRVEQAKEALHAQGLRVYEVGFVVKNLVVCNFCKGAEVEGLDAARMLDDAVAGQPVPFPLRVGYSGCPNACGESLSKDIGVVKIKNSFHVYVGGETKTLKATAGELLVDCISEGVLPEVVNQIIEIYRENGKKRERFSNFVRRYSVDVLREKLSISR